MGNTLRIMLRKGLLEKSGDLYRTLDLDPEVVLSRVYLRRVRYPWQVLKPRHDQEYKGRDEMPEGYQFLP